MKTHLHHSPTLALFRKYLRVPVTALLLCTFGMWSNQAKAAIYVWDPDANAANNVLNLSGTAPTATNFGGVGTWNNANANWWTGSVDQAWVNANADTAWFAGLSGGAITTGNPMSAGGLIFTTGGYTTTLTAINTLTLTGTPIINAAAGASIGTASVNGLLGTAGFTKNGGGTLTILGTNTGLSGGVTVNAGALTLSSANLGVTQLNTSNITLNFGTLNILNNAAGSNTAAAVAYGNNLVINGNSSFGVNNAGANTNNTISIPTLTVNNSALTFTSANGYGAQVVGATSLFGAITTLNSGFNPLTQGALGVAASVNNTAQLAAFSGAISGGTLNKTGTGTVTLQADNTYTGGTNILAGSLLLNTSAATLNNGTGGNVIVTSVGTLGVVAGSNVNITGGQKLIFASNLGATAGGAGILRVNANSDVLTGSSFGSAIVSPYGASFQLDTGTAGVASAANSGAVFTGGAYAAAVNYSQNIDLAGVGSTAAGNGRFFLGSTAANTTMSGVISNTAGGSTDDIRLGGTGQLILSATNALGTTAQTVQIGAPINNAGNAVQLSALAGTTTFNPATNNSGLTGAVNVNRFTTLSSTATAGANVFGAGTLNVYGGTVTLGAPAAAAGTASQAGNSLINLYPAAGVVAPAAGTGSTLTLDNTLNNSAGGATNARLVGTTPINMYGVSTLSFIGSNTAATTTNQGTGTLTFQGGNVINLTVNSTAASNSDAVLTIANLARSGNGTIAFTRAGTTQPASFGLNGGATSDSRVILTQINGVSTSPITNVVTNGMIAPWMVDQTASTFLTYNAANGITPVTYAATALDAATLGTELITNAGGAITGNRSVQALQLTSTTGVSGAFTITIGSGAAAADGAGLILSGAATHSANFSFGTAGAREAVIFSSAATTISGTIAASGLTKFGGSNLTLTGANTGLGGTITVNQAALVGSTSGYNFRPITLASAQVDFDNTNNGIYLNDVTVAGDGLISGNTGRTARINSITISARSGTGTAPVNLQINNGLIVGNYDATYVSGSGTSITGGGLVLSAPVNWSNGQAASSGAAGAGFQNILGVVSGGAGNTINKFGNAALSFSNAGNTFQGGIVINGAGGDNRGAIRSLVGTATATPFGTGSITVNPGGVVALSAPDNASGNALILNSDRNGLAMVSLFYGGSAALPTFASTTLNNTNLSGPFAGVLASEAVGFSTAINLNTLWGGTAFLGGGGTGQTGTFTGSITPSSVNLIVPDLNGGQPVAGNNVYRIGAGGGANMIFAGAANQFTGANDIQIGAISNVTAAASIGLQLGNANTIIYNSNNISGNTFLNTGGVLIAGRNDAIGTSKLIFNGGTIQADGNTGLPNNNAIRTLSNNIGFTGDAVFGNATDLMLSGTVALADNQSGVTRTLNVASTAGIAYLTGVISNGAGSAAGNSITKTGAGPLVLSGVNTYTGYTNINAGTLLLTSDANIPTASTVTLGGGSLGAWGSLGNQSTTFVPTFTTSRDYILTAASTFDVGPGVTLTQAAPTGTSSASIISGAFALTKAGLGTLTLGGINSMSGVSVNNGILQAAGGANLGDPNAASAITLNGGTFRPTSTFTTNRLLTATTGSVDVPTGVTLTLTGVISGANFVKTGLGTFTNNSGTNTNTVLTVENGTILFNGTNTPWAAATAISVNGGVLQITNTTANRTTSTSGSLTFGGGGTLGLQSATGFSNQITAANINRSGAGTLIIDPGTSALAVAGNTNNVRVIPSTLINGIAVASANFNGILPGNIVTQVSGIGSFATYTGANGIGTGAYTLTNSTATLGATTNVSVVDVTTTPVTAFTTATQSVYALRTNQNLAGGTLRISSINGLTDTKEGGLIINGSRTIGANIIFDPTAASGGTAASGEGLIYVNSGSTATISGAVSATSLVKFGPGDLTLSGSTGVINALTVQQGTLNFSGGLTFDKGITDLVLTNAGAFNVSGSRVTFNSLSNGAAVTGGIAGGLVTNTTGSGTLVINTMNSATSNTFTGQLNDGAGTLALAKNGLGTAILAPFNIAAPDAGNNSLSGGVTLTQGTLTIQDPRAVGSGTLTLQGGQVNGTTLTGVTLSLLSNGPGINSTIVVGNGSANITGVNVVSNGYTTINADRIASNSGNIFQFNNLALNEGQLSFTNANSYHVRFSGTTTIAGAFGTINSITNAYTVAPDLAGVVAGSGTLQKLGSGGIGTGLIISGTANTYTGGTNIQSGYLQVTGTTGTPLGTGRVQVYPGAMLRLAGNVGAAGTVGGATLSTLSRFNSYGMVALDNDNFDPATNLNSTAFSNAYGALLGISRPFYAGNLDQSTIGDGRSILVSALGTEVDFLGTLAPGLGDDVANRTYRIAGGVNNLAIIGQDNILNDTSAVGTSLQVGTRVSSANNGAIANTGNFLLIRNSNSFTGGSWIGKGSGIQIETGASPAGSTPLGSSDGTLTGTATGVEIFGTLQNAGLGSSYVNAATGKNSITPTLRPGGNLTISDQLGIAAGGQGRWADTDANGGAINLGSGLLVYNGVAGLPSVEQIGTLTVSGEGRVIVNRQNDANTTTLLLGNLVRTAPAANGVGAGVLTLEPRQANAATGNILGIPNLATTQLQQAAGFVRLITNSGAPSLGGTTVNGTGVTNSGMAPAWIIDAQANSFVTYNPTAANTGFQPLQSTASPNPGQVSYNKLITAALTAGQIVAGDIVDLSTATNTLADASTTIYALRTNQTINPTAVNNTLTLTSGGLIFTSGAAQAINSTVTSANTVPLAMTLNFGTGGAGEAFIYNGTAFDNTINATIVASALTRFAPQGNGNQLILTGNNSITGPITVNAGLLGLRNILTNTGAALSGPTNGQDVILAGAGSRDASRLILSGGVGGALGSNLASNSSAMALLPGTVYVNGEARVDVNGSVISQRLTNLTFADRGVRSPNYLFMGGGVSVQGTTTLGANDNSLDVTFDNFAQVTLAGLVQGGTLSKYGNGTLQVVGTANTFSSLIVNGNGFNTASSIVGSLTQTGTPFGSGAITVNPGGALRIMNASNIASNSSITVKTDEQGLGSIGVSTNLTSAQIASLFGSGAGKVSLTSTHPIYAGGVTLDTNSFNSAIDIAALETAVGGAKKLVIGSSINPLQTYFNSASVAYYASSITSASDNVIRLGVGGNQGSLAFGVGTFENVFGAGKNIEIGAASSTAGGASTPLINGYTGTYVFDTRNTAFNGTVTLNPGSLLSLENAYALGSGTIVLNQNSGVNGVFNNSGIRAINSQTIANNINVTGDLLNLTSGGDNAQFTGAVNLNPTGGVGGTKWFGVNGNASGNVGTSTNVAFTGVISGSGVNIIKGGSNTNNGGNWILRGTNTYSGTTTIVSGSLTAGGDVLPSVAGPFGNSDTPIALGNVGTQSAGSIYIGGQYTFGRGIIDTGITGNIVATIRGNSLNTSVITGGILLNRAAATGGGLALENASTAGGIGGVLDVQGPITGPGTIQIGNGGQGIVRLSANAAGISTSTFAGGVNVFGGRVQVAADASFTNGSATPTIITSPFGTGTLFLGRQGSTTAGIANQSSTFTQVDAFGGDRTIVNPLGTINVAGNVGFNFGGRNNLTFSNAAAFDLNTDGTVRSRTFSVLTPGTVTFASALSNTAAMNMVKNGIGTLVLTGTNTQVNGNSGDGNYGRSLFIDNGIVSVSADANLGSTTLSTSAFGSHIANNVFADVALRGGVLQATASFNTARQLQITTASGIDVLGSGITLGVTQVTTGAFGITKTGTGTLSLNPAANANNTITTLTIGGFPVGSGTVNSSNTAGTPLATSTVAILGGTLGLVGGATAQALTVPAVTFGSGSRISLNRGTTTTLLTATALTRANQGTLIIQPTTALADLGAAATFAQLKTSTTFTTTNGMLATPTVIVQDPSTNDFNFVQYGANGFALHGSTTTASLAASAATSLADLSVATAVSNATTDIYAVRTSANITSGGASSLLRIVNGGLILNGTTTPPNVSANLEFDAGTAGTAGEAFVYVRGGQTGVSTISSNFTSTNFTKSGAGTLLLSGTANVMAATSTQVRNISINEGTLQFAGQSSLPSSGLITISPMDTGIFDLNGQNLTIAGLGNPNGTAITATGNVSNSGAASTLTLNVNNQTSTFNGLITNGTGVLSVTKSGIGTQVFGANNFVGFGGNTYTGTTTINAGQITSATGLFTPLGTLQGTGITSFGTGGITLAGGILSFNNAIAASEVDHSIAILTQGPNNGYDVTINALNYFGTANTTSFITNTNGTVWQGINTVSVASGATLNFGGAGTNMLVKGQTSFAAASTINTVGSAVLSGKVSASGLALTKIGGNVLFLTNTELSSGASTVGSWNLLAGTTEVRMSDGGSSPLGGGSVTLNGATLNLRHDGDNLADAQTLSTWAGTNITVGSSTALSNAGFIPSVNATLNTQTTSAASNKLVQVGALNFTGALGAAFLTYTNANSYNIEATGGITMVKDAYLSLTNGPFTLSTGLSGNGTFFKQGGGEFDLNTVATNTGGTMLFQGNTYFGSFAGNTRTLSTTAQFAPGDVTVNIGTVLRFNAASNINAASRVDVRSNLNFYGIVGIGSNESISAFNLRAPLSGGPSASSLVTPYNTGTGVLGINNANYTQSIDMSKLGDGTWYLGSIGNGAGVTVQSSASGVYTGTAPIVASPAAYNFGSGSTNNANNILRLGGNNATGATFTVGLPGGTANTLTNATGAFAKSTSLVVGGPSTGVGSNGSTGPTVAGGTSGIVILNTAQNYTGNTLVNTASTLEFRGAMSTSGYDVFGTLAAGGANGSFAGGPNPVMRQGSLIRLDNTFDLNSNASGRWGDTTQVNLNSSTFRLIGNAAVDITEVVGTVAYNGNSFLTTQRSIAGRSAELNVAGFSRSTGAMLSIEPTNNGTNSQLGTDERITVAGANLAAQIATIGGVTNGMVSPTFYNNRDMQFLTYSTFGFVNAGFDFLSTNATPTALTGGTNRALYNAQTTVTLAASQVIDVHALRLDNNGAATSYLPNAVASSTEKFIIRSGGLLVNGTNAAFSTQVNAGLQFGPTGTPTEALIGIQTNTFIIGDSANPSTSGQITATSISKSGDGALTIQSYQPGFSGPIYLNRGTLTLSEPAVAAGNTTTNVGGVGGTIFMNGLTTLLNLKSDSGNAVSGTTTFQNSVNLSAGSIMQRIDVNIAATANTNAREIIISNLTFGGAPGDQGQTLTVSGANNFSLRVGGTTDLGPAGYSYLNLVSNGTNLTLAGAIAGSGTLVAEGNNGTLFLGQTGVVPTAGWTTGGGLIVTTRTVQANAAPTTAAANSAINGALSYLGTGPITLAGGTLNVRVDAAGDTTARTYTFGSGNTVTVTGNTTLGMDRIATGSTKAIAFPSLNIGGQTLTSTSANTYTALFNAVNLTGTPTFSVGTDFAVQGVSDKGAGLYVVKTATGSLWYNDNTSTNAGVYVNQGTLRFGNATAASTTATIGTGTVQVNPQGAIRVDAGTNLASGQLTTLGTVWSLPNLRILPAVTQANLVAFTNAASTNTQLRLEGAYTTALTMSTIGDGSFWLGVQGSQTYSGNTLGAGAQVTLGQTGFVAGATGGTYRLGSNDALASILTLAPATAANPILTGTSNVVVGSLAIGGNNGSGTVLFNQTNNYTLGTTISRGSVGRITTGTTNTPLGSGQVDVFGTLQAIGANGSFVGGGTTNTNTIVMHPGSTVQLDGNIATAGNNYNRWGTDAVSLNGSQFFFNSQTGQFGNESIGAITYANGSRIAIQNPGSPTGANVLTSTGTLTRTGTGTIVFVPADIFGTNAANTDNFVASGGLPAIVTAGVNMLPAYIIDGDTTAARQSFLTDAGGGSNRLVNVTYTDTNFAAPTNAKIGDITATTTLAGDVSIFAMRVGAFTINNAPGQLNTITLNQAAVAGGGILTNGAATINPNLNFNGQEALLATLSNLTLNGDISGVSSVGITKFGGGTLTIGKDQTDAARGTGAGYSNGWTINEGQLTPNTFGALGNAVSTNIVRLNASTAAGANANGIVGAAVLRLALNAGNPSLSYYTMGDLQVLDAATISYDPQANDRMSALGAAGSLSNIVVSSTGGTLNDAQLFLDTNRDRSAVVAGNLEIKAASGFSNPALQLRVHNSNQIGATSSGLSVNTLVGVGTSRITKIGTGELYIRGDSSASFSGNISIEQGAIGVSHNNSLGSGTTTVKRYGVLDVQVANYAPTVGTIAYQTGGIERWSVDGARTGTLILGSGTLQVNNDQTANTLAVTMNGGSIEGYLRLDDNLTGGQGQAVYRTLNSNITFNLTGDSYLGQNINQGLNGFDNGRQPTVFSTAGNSVIGAVLEIKGAFSGAGGLTKQGYDTITLSGANTYSGQTNLLQGMLRAGATNALPSSNILSTTGGAVFDLNGYNLSIGRITSPASGFTAATFTANLANSNPTGSGYITNSALDTTKTLSVGNGANGTSSDFTYGGVIQYNIALEKNGAAVLNLTNANTYNGGTTLNGGWLNAANTLAGTTGSATGSGAVNIVGGTLAGAGTVAGIVTLGASGAVQPGGLTIGTVGNPTSNAGTLTLGGLTINGGVITFQLGSIGGNSDLITLTGLDPSGSSILNITTAPTLNILNLTGFGVGTHNLIGYGNGTAAGFGFLPLHPTSPIAGYVLTTQNNTTTKFIELLIQRNTTAVWSGAEDQLWNTLTHTAPKNWVDLVGSPSDFAQTFDVTFDNTATGYTPMLDGTMYPQSVTFNNTTTYTLGLQNSLASDKISNIPTITGITGDTDGTTAVITNISSTTGLLPGMAFTGLGIPSGATIASVDSSTQVTLSVATTSANTATGLTGGPANGNTTFTKSNTGLVILNTPNNDFTGGSTLNAGTLRMGASTTVTSGAITGGPLGTGAIQVNGGTIQDDGSARSIANSVILGGNVTFDTTGGGSLTFTNEVTGNTTALTTSPTVTVNNTTTFQQVISGSGRAITKAGSGTLIFTAVNTYDGGTTVNNGTLTIGTTGRLATGSNLSIASTATAVNLNNNTAQTLGTVTVDSAANLNTATTTTVTTLNGASTGVITQGTGTSNLTVSNGTYSGTILGTAALTKTGTGADNLTLNNSGNTYSAGTSLNAGTITVGASTVSGTTITSGPIGTGTLTMAAGTTLAGATAPRTLANAVLINGNITLAGTNLTLDGTGLTVPTMVTLGATSQITVGAGLTESFNSVVTDGGSTFALTKAGTGQLNLNNVDNSYTGVTTINAGVLGVTSLENHTVTTADSLGDSSSAAANLVINGATLQYLGSGSTTDRQMTIGTTGGTLDASGTGPVVFSNATTAGLTLSGTNTARTLNLLGSNTGSNVLSAIVANNGTGLTAITKTGTGTWRLANTASTTTGIVIISGGVLEVTKLAAGGSASSIGQSSNAVTNLLFNNGATLRWIGDGVVTNDSTDRLFTVVSGNSVIDASPTDSTKSLTFSNAGSVSFSGSPSNQGKALTWTGSGGTIANPNVFTPIIPNNGTGTTQIVKAGAGVWRFAGVNSASDFFSITNGTVIVNNVQNGGVSSNLGAGAVAAANLLIGSSSTAGTLRFDGSGAVNNSTNRVFTLGAAGGTIDASGAAGTPLLFTSATALTMGVGTTTPRTLTLTGANTDDNTLTNVIPNGTGAGLTSVAKTGDGTWQLSSVNTYTGSTTISGGVLKSGINNAINAASAVTVAAASPSTSATWDLTTRTQTSNSVTLGGVASSTPTISGGVGSVLTLGGNVTYDATSNPGAGTISVPSLALGTASRTFNVGDSSNATADLTVSSLISGGAGGAIVKAGAGTLVLTGANSYTGTTSVNAGTLQVGVAGAGSLGSSSVVTVASTGTLSGSGTVFGATTVQSGAFLTPGDGDPSASNATLTFGSSLALDAGGNTQLTISSPTVTLTGTDLANVTAALNAGTYTTLQAAISLGSLNALNIAPGAGAHDRLVVTGTLTWTTGSTITVLNRTGGSYTAGTPALGDIFNLLDFASLAGTYNVGTQIRSGGTGGGDFDLPDLSAAGLSWDTSALASHGIVAVIPEPSRSMLLFFGLLGLCLRRRRKA